LPEILLQGFRFLANEAFTKPFFLMPTATVTLLKRPAGNRRAETKHKGLLAMLKLIAKIQTMPATKDEGATAVEYALLVSLIAVAIIVAVRALGVSVSSLFQTVVTAVS
jgi:pilus assembly protein Flp/PilA